MPPDPAPHVAAVLGAGGVAGGAWHAGALAALEERGWDARTADLLVGTSAGSGVSAALRTGFAATDMLAGAVGTPMSSEGARYAEAAGPAPGLPGLPEGGRFRPPADPLLAARALSPPWRLRPTVALAGLLPRGSVSNAFIGDRIRRTHPALWPERPTWICAVRLGDGARVVFGRDVLDAHIATAVEASSAIPGWFTPVEHGGAHHVDGGVHSPTNADLVAGLGFDLVVVSSPMSATRSALRRGWTGSRPLHAATLRREVAAVRAAGTPVLVLQPDGEFVAAAGPNAMDPTRRPALAALAHRTVAAHLDRPEVADRLAVLLH